MMPDISKAGPNGPEPSPLLGQRAALILALAVLVGIGAFVLTALAGRHLAEAALYGAGAFAAAAVFFNWLIAQ